MDDIIITIGIPAYNRMNHLKRLLNYYSNEINDALANQVELIVSNDNSPDNTKAFLCSIKNPPKWLVIINNDVNLGSHGNMKQIIDLAKGKYIWLPGDDDYLKIGLIKKLVSVLTLNNDLAYLFLSRLGINETTKQVTKKMKRHDIEYDKSYKVSYKSLVSLLKENFGDLKFQGSTVVKRSIALMCDKEITYYSKDTQDDCYSLFRAFRGMQSGNSYFISDICVLNGNEISWGNKMIKYLFISDVEFVEGLSKFGMKQQDCKRISNRLLGSYYSGLISDKNFYDRWVKIGKPGFRLSAWFSTLFLVLRRVAYKLHISNIYQPVFVDLSQFGINREAPNYE